MSYEVRTTKSFDRDVKSLAKRYASLGIDLASFISSLEVDPTQGESLGRDCYKVRLAIKSKGKGKRGGSRVVTCVKVVDETVHLLSIYDKSEEDTISPKELSERLKAAGL